MTNSGNEYVISDDMRDLILKYMTACNEGEYAKAEGLLQRIKELGALEHEERSKS